MHIATLTWVAQQGEYRSRITKDEFKLGRFHEMCKNRLIIVVDINLEMYGTFLINEIN